jgi:hypothetical protein
MKQVECGLTNSNNKDIKQYQSKKNSNNITNNLNQIFQPCKNFHSWDGDAQATMAMMKEIAANRNPKGFYPVNSVAGVKGALVV